MLALVLWKRRREVKRHIYVYIYIEKKQNKTKKKTQRKGAQVTYVDRMASQEIVSKKGGWEKQQNRRFDVNVLE